MTKLIDTIYIKFVVNLPSSIASSLTFVNYVSQWTWLSGFAVICPSFLLDPLSLNYDLFKFKNSLLLIYPPRLLCWIFLVIIHQSCKELNGLILWITSHLTLSLPLFLFLVVASNEFEINQQDLFDNSSGNSTYNDQKLPYPSIINYNQINARCIYTAKKKIKKKCRN